MVNWKICERREEPIEFLTEWANETDPPVSIYPGGVEGTVDMLLSKGQILFGMEEGVPVAFCGYTFGEPSNNFRDLSIGYVYLAVVSPKYRGRFFPEGLKEVARRLRSAGSSEMRFKANEANKRLNTFYRRFARDAGLCDNSSGVSSRLYSVDLSSLR